MRLTGTTVVGSGPDWTLRVRDGYYQRAGLGNLRSAVSCGREQNQTSGQAFEINSRLLIEGWENEWTPVIKPANRLCGAMSVRASW